HELITPLLVERHFIGIPPILKEVDFALGSNFQLKFAIEEALFDLIAKKIKTPVVNLLGGQQRSEVPIMRMLGLKPPEETAKEAQSLIQEGYRFIKLKIGLDENRDLATAERVRGAVGNDVFISVDANQAYTPMQAVRVLNKLSKFDIGIVEQPVRQDDIRGMAFVRKQCRIPIMADEGILNPSDALRHIEADAMDAVSIKLWKMGGYYRSRDIACACASANVGVHIGSTAGSRLMEAMQLHFAASLPELMAGAEIGEFEGLTNDPASGLQVTNGKLSLSNVPGLGVELDLSKMRETTQIKES
ncbi:MAG: mandelate racemase/muconate lactonizing enzyme family protein, partial [Gammaproteobacteria bacterium]